MSHTATQTADAHASHVLPLRIYFGVASALLVLTAITYWVAQHDFGGFNLVVALGVAVFKGTLVALYFMHLRYDKPFYAFTLCAGIVTLGIFIGLTMIDTTQRNIIKTQTGAPILAQADIQAVRARSNSPLSGSGAPGSGAAGLSEFQLKNGIGPITTEVSLGALDMALADQGQKVFEVKCLACHKLNERLVGPALRDVTKRRSPEYIMNMILNPAEMTQKHPEAKKLVGEYFTFMTFQNVTPADARAILEYFRVAAEGKK